MIKKIFYRNIIFKFNIYFFILILLFMFNNNKVFGVDYGYNKSDELIFMVNEVVSITNDFRVECGLQPLNKNDILMYVADIRANELINNFSTNRPNGTTTGNLLEQFGYFNSINEPSVSIASGPNNPFDLVTFWTENEESRNMILQPDAYDIGVGVARDGLKYYWILILAEPNMTLENQIVLQNVLDSIITDNMSVVEKVKAVHDYICLYLDYDYNYKNRTITDALNYKTAVCQGYANMFKAFMDLLGIENEFVAGHANGMTFNPLEDNYINHAWNLVIIDNVKYYIDTTWDDLTKEYNIINYDCFMIDELTMNNIHEKAKLKVIHYDDNSIVIEYEK